MDNQGQDFTPQQPYTPPPPPPPPPAQGYTQQQSGYNPTPPIYPNQPNTFVSHPPASYPGKGMVTASLVLGIVSLTIGAMYGIGFITAIIGLILGIIGKRKAIEVGAPTGTATAGIVLSIIALILSILIIVACIACLGYIGMQDYSYYWY